MQPANHVAMNASVLRTARFSAVFVALAGWLHAHPGHEGHDLTWDFAHLANHPLATFGCLAVLGAGVTLVVQSVRRRRLAPVQSLRASQASRGK